jgi:hypothetical protein
MTRFQFVTPAKHVLSDAAGGVEGAGVSWRMQVTSCPEIPAFAGKTR